MTDDREQLLKRISDLETLVVRAGEALLGCRDALVELTGRSSPALEQVLGELNKHVEACASQKPGSKIIGAKILYCGQPLILACDGRCDKAWGISTRPKVQLSDDEDDFALWADDELGEAPADPGTEEGFQAKPTKPEQRLRSKWCARECERSGTFEIGMPIRVKDLSRRRHNKLRHGENLYREVREHDIEWVHPPDSICKPTGGGETDEGAP